MRKLHWKPYSKPHGKLHRLALFVYFLILMGCGAEDLLPPPLAEEVTGPTILQVNNNGQTVTVQGIANTPNEPITLVTVISDQAAINLANPILLKKVAFTSSASTPTEGAIFDQFINIGLDLYEFQATVNVNDIIGANALNEGNVAFVGAFDSDTTPEEDEFILEAGVERPLFSATALPVAPPEAPLRYLTFKDTIEIDDKFEGDPVPDNNKDEKTLEELEEHGLEYYEAIGAFKEYKVKAEDINPEFKGRNTIRFQNGSFPNNNYQGTQDATINEGQANTNDGNGAELFLDGNNGNNTDLKSLLQFDLTDIPAGADIKSATLRIFVTNPSGNENYAIREVRRSWVENQVTFNQAANNTPWAGAGATDNDDIDTQNVMGNLQADNTGFVEADFNNNGLQVIEDWVNNPESNNGFIIENTNAFDGMDFASSENANAGRRPQLEIEFELKDVILSKSTLQNFKLMHGWDDDALEPAVFYNGGDFGLGRKIRCLSKEDENAPFFSEGLIPFNEDPVGMVCISENFGNLDDPIPAQEALRLAINPDVLPFASVAMEYMSGADENTPNGIKFYVYIEDGSILPIAILDSEGVKAFPDICTVCHGGTYDNQERAIYGASYLPLAVPEFEYLNQPGFELFDQIENMTDINEMFLDLAIVPSAVKSYVSGLSQASAQADINNDFEVLENYVMPGWEARPELYREAFAPYCRACHQTSRNLPFETANEFIALKSIVVESVCGDFSMPQAEITHSNFWGSEARAIMLQELEMIHTCDPEEN